MGSAFAQNSYIATCFTHFGAIRYKKICEKAGFSAKLIPVPRSLSSSCGTCVYFTGSQPPVLSDLPEEVEQVVEEKNGDYIPLYRAENI